MRPAAHLALCAITSIALGCNLDNPGDSAPAGTLYFPNGLAVVGADPGGPPRLLLVANSNFDLRYNSGTLQAYSLDAIANRVAACSADAGTPDDGPDTGTSAPAPCVLVPEDLLVEEARIGSFANGLSLSPDGRLAFIATRTDKSLTVLPLDAASDDVFDCAPGELRCGTQASLGVDGETGKAAKEWPGDPVTLLARPMSDWVGDDEDLGDYVVVAHMNGAMSLFVETLDAARRPTGEFQMTDSLGIGSLATGIAFDPITGALHISHASVFNGGKTVQRVRVVMPDLGTSGRSVPDTAHASLAGLGPLLLEGVGLRTDTRAIGFFDGASGGAAGEALLVARDPNSLLLADLDETRNRIGFGRVTRTAVLGAGPTRMVLGELQTDGEPLRIAAIACFNAREIFVVDVDTMRTRTVVPNLSGPFELALDAHRQMLYVADFRSSVIRVIDLAPLTDPTATEGGRVVATIGTPRIIQELQ